MILKLLFTKLIKAITNPKKVFEIIRHPELIIQIARNFRYAKVLGKGERAIIHNWEKARNREESYWNWGQLAHINRYEWASSFIKGLKVLDNGCGAGCGTYYLVLHGAAEAVGIDYSFDAIKWGKRRYQAKNLKLITANSLHLPFRDNYFDVIVSFDVLEHIAEKDQRNFISEIIRVMRQSGTLLIGCPNREASECILTNDNNLFHLHELNKEEFEKLLSEYFKDVAIKGEDMVVDGRRLKEKWLEYLYNNKVKMENIVFVDTEVERTRGLLAICRKPKTFK